MLIRWPRMGVGHAWKTSHVIRVGAVSHMIPARSPDLGEWRVAGNWDQSCGQGFNQPGLLLKLHRIFWLANTSTHWEGDVPWFYGRGPTCLLSGPSQTRLYMFLYLACSTCILCSKTGLVNIVLSRGLGVPVNYQNRVLWNTGICSWLVRKGSWGPLSSQQSCGGLSPSLVESALIPCG